MKLEALRCNCINNQSKITAFKRKAVFKPMCTGIQTAVPFVAAYGLIKLPHNEKEFTLEAEHYDILEEHAHNIFKYLAEQSNRNEKFLEILQVRDASIKKKDMLIGVNHNLNTPIITMVDNLLFSDVNATMNVIDTIGLNSFLYSFKDKYANVEEYIQLIGKTNLDFNIKQALLEKINPTKSNRYEYLERTVKNLKKDFNQIQNSDERVQRIRDINNNTVLLNQMIKSSLKDPKDKLELAIIVTNLFKHGVDPSDVITSYTEQQNPNLLKVLDQKKYQFFGLNNSNDERLDFSNCKYLTKLFYPSETCYQQFKHLFEIILSNPDINTLDIFNNMTQNIKTREIFEKYKLNYDQWVADYPTSYEDFENIGSSKLSYRVQKANMNDIRHAAFLGDDSNCCTKVGNGLYKTSALPYLENKLVSAIEVVYDGNIVGNAMCFVGIVDSKPSIIIDDIEFKETHLDCDYFAAGMFSYSKQLAKEIGGDGTPVYLASNKHKISLSTEKTFKDVNILGCTDSDPIYVSFLHVPIFLDESGISFCPNVELREIV